jgi:hypothetical protein
VRTEQNKIGGNAAPPAKANNRRTLRKLALINRSNQVCPTERGVWTVRKEARECWDYGISDEAVYFAQSATRDSDVAYPIPKLYLRGNLWLEIEFFFVAERNAYLNCILEIVVDQNSRILGNEDRETSGCERNSLMLIVIAKKVQLPESMVLRRTSSVIWLKQFDFLGNSIREESQNPVESLVPFFNNGEIDVLGEVSLGVEEGQIPRGLVKTRTQTVEKFSKQHSDDWRNRTRFCAADMPSILGVIFSDDGIRFSHIDVNLSIKRIEMHLRPAGLHLYIGKPIHSRTSEAA